MLKIQNELKDAVESVIAKELGGTWKSSTFNVEIKTSNRSHDEVIIYSTLFRAL